MTNAKQIKGNRCDGRNIQVGFAFGKKIAGVQGIATVTEIVRVEQREGQWDKTHYIAEWMPEADWRASR